MQISEENLLRYHKVFQEKYGFEISRAKALEELTALVCLISAVHRHINQNND